MTSDRLFVYGTLMRGYVHPMARLLSANADFLGEALDTLITALSELRSDLRHGDALDRTFGDAERWRAELMKGRD